MRPVLPMMMMMMMMMLEQAFVGGVLPGDGADNTCCMDVRRTTTVFLIGMELFYVFYVC